MKKDVELKPCPFCGARGKVGQLETSRPGSAWRFTASCESKRCGLRPFNFFATYAAAVKAWNTRTASASAPAPITRPAKSEPF